ncbi:MAG: hypothetical protein K9I02_07795 [Haliscomenobacter sp.]|nr:hypothetical protein [Haliscomenobacter sp.]
MNVPRFLLHLEKATFMITKKHLKETIEKLPEEFSLEDLIDKLILLDKIERAEKESGRGETITEEALDRELEKWFK